MYITQEELKKHSDVSLIFVLVSCTGQQFQVQITQIKTLTTTALCSVKKDSSTKKMFHQTKMLKSIIIIQHAHNEHTIHDDGHEDKLNHW